jgi:hypothetical protein
MRRGKVLLALALASSTVLVMAWFGNAASADGTATYRVRIANLTDGQPLTPPAIVTHRNHFELFTVGDLASVGVMQVAENGNVPNLVSALEQANGKAEE